MAENQAPQSDVVIDRGTTPCRLVEEGGLLAIWLGFLILIIGAFIFLPAKLDGMDEAFSKSNAVMSAEAARGALQDRGLVQGPGCEGEVPGLQPALRQGPGQVPGPPPGWSNNPLDSLILSKDQAAALSEKGKPGYEKAKAATEAALAAAVTAEKAAEAATFGDAALNEAAKDKIGDWRKARPRSPRPSARPR
jgi:hypothetical protein